jgi:hypothetical protein
LNNTAKNFKGKMQGLQRTDVIAQTYKDQEYLEQYALRNPSLASYVPLFEENKKLYDRKFELSTDYIYLNQLYRNGIFSGGAYIALYADRAAQSKDSKAYISENKAAIIKTMGAYRSVVNKESLEKNLFAELYYRLSQSNLQEVREVFLLPVMGQDKAGIKAYANELWEDSKMQNVAKNDSLLHQKTAKFLKTRDKLVKLGSDVNAIFSSMQTEMTQINAEIDAIIPRFNDLEMELNEGKFIPDANGTLRFTYGYIKGYEPEDAVILEPFTTIQGIIEKAEGTDNPDYYLQQEYIDKMKEIEPADVLKHPENGEVVAGLLYNMDTTGGNSGSPIMDSNGRIVGVNFDRAYTATINDYAWNESYSRSIGVDIRYVLYVMKYFGGANKVLGEMGVEL